MQKANKMAVFVAIVALANLGIGFALAIHLARQHRKLPGAVAGSAPLGSAAAEPPVAGPGDRPRRQ